MITRRQFLIGTASSAAGLFTPSFITRANQFIQETATPFLESVDTPLIEMIAQSGSGGYYLHIGNPYKLPFELTIDGVVEAGAVEEDWFYDQVVDDLQLKLGEDPSFYFDEWLGDNGHHEVDIEMINRNTFPSGKAYNELYYLDLGEDFEARRTNAVGEIDFIDGACPGNDYLGVHVKDDISLSLLQNRLIQLNTGIQIQID